MEAFRISSPSWPLLDGTGAAMSDAARWNGRGRFVIYASEHYATAMLEKTAQLNSIKIPRTLVYVRIALPADVTVETLEADGLAGWDDDNRAASRQYGNRWYDERRSLALVVPSLAAPGLERNVLINQRHPEFTRVKGSTPRPVSGHPRLVR